MTESLSREVTGAPILSPEVVAMLSGLDRVRAMCDGKLAIAPMLRLMNMSLIEAQDGLVVVNARPEPRHYNPRGTVHGAFTAAVLDSAMGLSVLTKLPARTSQTTLELKLNFVRPMLASIGEVRGEGRVIHAGRNIATAESRLLDADGRIIAHGSTTCMIFSEPQP